MKVQDIKTFADLCWYNSTCIMDTTIEPPNWKRIDDYTHFTQGILKEHTDIERKIYAFNLLGFYTNNVMLGFSSLIEKFHSNHYDFMMDEAIKDGIHYDNVLKPDGYLEGKFETYRRASVAGYMLKDKALKLKKIVEINPNYVVLLSCLSNDDDMIYLMSAKDGRLMHDEAKQDEIISSQTEPKMFDGDIKFKSCHRVDKMGYSRGKNFRWFEKLQKDFLPNMDSYYFEDDVVVHISITDKRWNCNDKLWDDVLWGLYSLK